MQLVYSAHTHSVGVGEVPGVGQPAAEVVICASPVRHTHREHQLPSSPVMGITALLTALLFSVTSNQTNCCSPRYNAVTVTDNKMRRYYNLL